MTWLAVLGFLIFLGMLLAGHRYVEYGRTIESTEDRLMAQARVVNENLGANLTFINVVLNDVIAMLDATPRMSTAALNKYLHHQDDLIPGIRTIFITDARGKIILSSNDRIIGFNGSGRDYFKTAQRISDPYRLIITPPFQTILGRSVITVTKAIWGMNGEFRGVASASLDREYFNTLLRSVLYAPDNRVRLVHAGGDVFITIPESTAIRQARNLARPGSFFQRHSESGKVATIQRGRSLSTGDERIVALMTCVPSDLQVEYPLVIAISRSTDAVLAPWKRDTVVYAAFYFLICGLTAATAGLIIRYRMSQKRAAEEHLKLHHLESLETLAEGMTHDFNNLLATIVGHIQIVQTRVQPDEVVYRSLTTAIESCFTAKQLCQRLSTFSTGGEQEKVVQPISDILTGCIKEVMTGSPVSVDVALPEDLRPAPVASAQIRQVFLNLLTNAKDAMPSGGTLTVRGVNFRKGPEDKLPIPDGDYIQLMFQDTGRGIAEENIPRIFDPYFSTQDTYTRKGLGLGLAVCYSVVRRHGGLISIASREGHGTTVTVFLPAAQ